MATQGIAARTARGFSDKWEAFRKGDQEARDALLAENLSLVHHIARQAARTLKDVEHDDLVSSGTLGLIAAMRSFDPSRGMAFSTYAVPRIRGTMLDEIRRQDHVPRSIRHKSRKINQARLDLAQKLGRRPKSREIAASLGIEIRDLWRWELEIEAEAKISLDLRPSHNDDHVSSWPLTKLATENSADDPEEELEKEQRLAALHEAMLSLNEQEHLVISLYFFEDLPLIEIGQILGLTESRVSQVRSRALGRLRSALSSMVSDDQNQAVERAWEKLLESPGVLDGNSDLRELMMFDE